MGRPGTHPSSGRSSLANRLPLAPHRCPAVCPNCRRGVDSGAWAHRHLHSNQVATTVMLHSAGTTTHKVGASCGHRKRPVVSVGAAAVPVPGKSCNLPTPSDQFLTWCLSFTTPTPSACLPDCLPACSCPMPGADDPYQG